jgi:hypothetical protein
MEKREISEEEMKYMVAVDEAIKHAAKVMELADLDEDMDEDEKDSVYEDRFHCGTCMVRTVMETIWPDLNNLMDFYERKPIQ